VITANVVPSAATPWVIGIGLAIDFFVAIIYWIRFASTTIA
jgi:hypothetical protein